MKSKEKEMVKEIKTIINQAEMALYFAGFNEPKRNIIHENAYNTIKKLINEQK